MLNQDGNCTSKQQWYPIRRIRSDDLHEQGKVDVSVLLALEKPKGEKSQGTLEADLLQFECFAASPGTALCSSEIRSKLRTFRAPTWISKGNYTASRLF